MNFFLLRITAGVTHSPLKNSRCAAGRRSNGKKNGVQDLIGLERFNNYGIKTDKAEIVFFAVEPTNISVLSSANIEIKVHDLTIVLSMIPDLEIIAMDSAECFDCNKWYVKERLQKEDNPAVHERPDTWQGQFNSSYR